MVVEFWICVFGEFVWFVLRLLIGNCLFGVSCCDEIIFLRIGIVCCGIILV